MVVMRNVELDFQYEVLFVVRIVRARALRVGN